MELDFFTRFDFFTGVPDSLLQPLCDWLIERYGANGPHHVIAANEGNAVGLAAGYHMATGKLPVVYLQNSGIGNIVNPVTSLLAPEVYGIPCLFIVGWRGEPGVHDEPQHAYMGKATLPLLCESGIETYIVTKDTTADELSAAVDAWKSLFTEGRSAALVVEKGAFSYSGRPDYSNANSMRREAIIEQIISHTGDDLIVSTTGKTSRELFELREVRGESHSHDFLTVGSMGHASSIAMGIALARPDKKVWVLDGDGAALMHLGAMAVIGSRKPINLVHIVFNNGAHESVGGLPTAAGTISLTDIAKACGYPSISFVDQPDALDAALEHVRESNTLSFLEICTAIDSRSDLGRPTVSAVDNKRAFMNCIQLKRG